MPNQLGQCHSTDFHARLGSTGHVPVIAAVHGRRLAALAARMPLCAVVDDAPPPGYVLRAQQ